MELNEEYTVKIEKMSDTGSGIAKINGQVLC